ncbi:ribonuclease P protein subunit p14-like [Ischnura elegans]|uniref:ribonuclease P protein subunit p14-like n=1 Tax=Ischnura elegans TaxID=197161 RepID=UPI001ED88493|nr:ribonuclease P protein subunit p14-like [Ischnura elegans]
MNQYFYLDVNLLIEGKVSFITSAHVKNHVTRALLSLFGEVGASIPVDVISFNPETCCAILRCPSKFYVKVHSSLSLCGQYEGLKCVYRIRKVSPYLLSLLSNSRDHKHS